MTGVAQQYLLASRLFQAHHLTALHSSSLPIPTVETALALFFPGLQIWKLSSSNCNIWPTSENQGSR